MVSFSEGPFGFPRLTSVGPFVTDGGSCSDTPGPVNWYSNILEQNVSHMTLQNSIYEDVYNKRYTQKFEDISLKLKETLGVRVGYIGQAIYLAHETRPSGVVTDERIEWMSNNTRDEDTIQGIKNMQKLVSDVLSEMPESVCIYRGLHGEIASYIKKQLRHNDEIVYSTRSIEFWSPEYSTSVTFSLEGIGTTRHANDIENAVIISKELDPDEVLGTEGDDWALLPKTDEVILNPDNIWVVR